MTPLQIAAAAGHLAGAACDILLDWIAPLPEEASWPDGEQSLIDEPPLNNDEITGLRQLLDERFGIALAATADEMIKCNPSKIPVPVLGVTPGFGIGTVEPLPTWVGNDNKLQDSPAAGTAVGGAAPADPPKAGAAHSKVTDAQLIAAAIGLREYANSDACEAPVYWRSVADQIDPK